MGRETSVGGRDGEPSPGRGGHGLVASLQPYTHSTTTQSHETYRTDASLLTREPCLDTSMEGGEQRRARVLEEAMEVSARPSSQAGHSGAPSPNRPALPGLSVILAAYRTEKEQQAQHDISRYNETQTTKKDQKSWMA